MTVARQVISGRTYLITRRCTQRQFLLRPDRHVEQIFLYCLGEAAERYQITLHGFIAMSNHEHLVVRDNLGNFPEFLAQLHKMVAKAMNARLCRCENFWASEQANAVYLVEAQDRFRKLIYLLANPVAEDLVDRISDWPGALSLGLHLSNGTLTVRKPAYFRTAREGGRLPETVTIRLERVDGFEDLSEHEWIAKLETALREEEESERERRREEGKGVLGRKAILRATPSDTPTTIEPRGGLRPVIACANKARRVVELAALLLFRAVRFESVIRTLAGEENVVFPFGTYRIRGFFRTVFGDWNVAPPLCSG